MFLSNSLIIRLPACSNGRLCVLLQMLYSFTCFATVSFFPIILFFCYSVFPPFPFSFSQKMLVDQRKNVSWLSVVLGNRKKCTNEPDAAASTALTLIWHCAPRLTPSETFWCSIYLPRTYRM